MSQDRTQQVGEGAQFHAMPGMVPLPTVMLGMAETPRVLIPADASRTVGRDGCGR
jgi:hypothetical protein